MLSTDLLKKIRRIEIRTSHLVTELLAGRYHSAFKGRGIEFEEVRPSAEDMAIYRHDWVATLKQAKDRAKKEGRPIFFIGNTNISGPTNFYSGHC